MRPSVAARHASALFVFALLFASTAHGQEEETQTAQEEAAAPDPAADTVFADENLFDFAICDTTDPTSLCYIDPSCDQSRSQNILPEKFVVYAAAAGDSYSVGDTVFILAKFPDTICAPVPDPEKNPGCGTCPTSWFLALPVPL
jgi:hypothetical protein